MILLVSSTKVFSILSSFLYTFISNLFSFATHSSTVMKASSFLLLTCLLCKLFALFVLPILLIHSRFFQILTPTYFGEEFTGRVNRASLNRNEIPYNDISNIITEAQNNFVETCKKITKLMHFN